MKKIIAVLLTIILQCTMLVMPVCADGILTELYLGYEQKLNFSYDLDGDGSNDNISMYETSYGKNEDLINISVNEKTYQIISGGWSTNVWLIDLDISDKTKEILIREQHHSTSWYSIIRYENNEITELNFDINGEISKFSIYRYSYSEDGEILSISSNGTIYISGSVKEFDGSGSSNIVNRTDKYQEIKRGTLTKFEGEPIALKSQQTNWESEKITVKLNNNEIYFDQPPIIYNDRTLVPMRAIFEAMGCEVEWDDGMIDVYKDDENIMTLWVNYHEMWLPSGSVTLDVAPMVINDRTLVPVRAITESMGATVEWDGDLKIVYIKY